MIQWISRLWHQGPTNLEADDVRGAIYIYRLYLVSYLIAFINLLIGPMTMPASQLGAYFVVAGSLFIILIIGGVLLSFRKWESAATLLFGYVWFVINGIALFFRGAQDPVIGLHIPLLIAIGYYFDFRRSFIVLILDIFILWGIAFLHQSGRMADLGMPTDSYTQLGDFAFWTITFICAGSVIYLSTQQTIDSKSAIEAKNKTLDEQRVALEAHKYDLEQLVQDRTKQLEWAKNRAEKASTAKSTFLAKMSHELRTPLNIIIGYSEMILEEPEKQASIIQDTSRIHVAGKHLLNIIDKILELSKIEEGQWQTNLDDILVSKLIHEIAFLATPLMLKQNNQLDFVWQIKEPEKQADFSVLADKQMLIQVFINLLSNAAKFTESGRVRFIIDEIELENGLKMAQFEVADTGKGIDPAFLPFIFNPFQQEEDSFARRHEGTGLGLAISKEMVEQMDGEISARNNRDGGATIRILLPKMGEAGSG